ncbi:MAG: 2-succinyl-5-enolpyruvyl-6-hydroxy-3-cyclohexene-1-carboxylic-acid synthase [Cyanobacteria bacterium RI_101]|nr:2-succinyl-5-enolpyruvyl-6-hydroxy-3-cyclohexene-1-carboxylic-acid synthase [Cyanobacteria bacterium RI_101]
MLDSRTVNSLWCSVLAETLVRLGLAQAVLCPGSRSSPLTLALARHPQIETLPALDERSAAFFALGLAKAGGKAVALVCTSGTAAANFFPALVEARMSQVPLLVLTADRPPELRHCRAGQTIDQVKLYGAYPQWQAELAAPENGLERLQYLRQTLVYAWEQAHWPRRGVVHLNCPFREPLAPPPEGEPLELPPGFDPETFFSALAPAFPVVTPQLTSAVPPLPPKGLILCGYCLGDLDPETVGALARRLGYPVLGDGISPLRNGYLGDYPLISRYDFILRSPETARNLQPQAIIQIGEPPTSKELRDWLSRQTAPVYILEPTGENPDPLHRPSQVWRCSPQVWLNALPEGEPAPESLDYCQAWLAAERRCQAQMDQALRKTEELLPGTVFAQLPRLLPPGAQVMVANSMPVRYLEYFWPPNPQKISLYVNRGANGIDGTLSTALGLAQGGAPTFLLTGDLSLLHDTNGFLLAPIFRGRLTIILLNNQGGGIFEFLPIAQSGERELFETYFAAPQNVDFAQLCRVYGAAYTRIASLAELRRALTSESTAKIRLWEIPVDRRREAPELQTLLRRLAAL